MFAFRITHISAEILTFAFVLDIESNAFARSILGFPFKSENNTCFKDFLSFIFFRIRSGLTGELGEISAIHDVIKRVIGDTEPYKHTNKGDAPECDTHRLNKQLVSVLWHRCKRQRQTDGVRRSCQCDSNAPGANAPFMTQAAFSSQCFSFRNIQHNIRLQVKKCILQ